MKKWKAVQGDPLNGLSRRERIRTTALTVRLVEGSFCLHGLARFQGYTAIFKMYLINRTQFFILKKVHFNNRGTPTRSSITDIYINVDHRSSIAHFDRDRKSSIVNHKLFHNRSSIVNRYFTIDRRSSTVSAENYYKKQGKSIVT